MRISLTHNYNEYLHTRNEVLKYNKQANKTQICIRQL